MKRMRVLKKCLSVVLFLIYLLSMASMAFASGTNIEPQANKEVIKTTIKGIASNFVGVVQGVFGVAAVVFVVWAGIIYWGAHGDPNKIQSAKRAFAGFIIAMVCVFFADKIVGGLMGIFGVK